MKTRYTVCGVLLSILFLVMGCGGTNFGPIGEIKGKLTMNSKPVPEGTKVIFMNSEIGHTGFAMTDPQGAYQIEWRREGKTFNGLPMGTYQVMIVPAAMADVDEMTADEMLEGGPMSVPTKVMIPRKYLRTSTSGLEYSIVDGENVIDIDIKS